MSLFFCLLLLFFEISCVTPKAGPEGGSEAGGEEVMTTHLFLDHVYVRRPRGPSAEYFSEPEDKNYQSKPLPDSHFDCVSWENLFKQIDFAQLKTCFSHLQQKEAEFRYTLKGGDFPVLKLLIEPKPQKNEEKSCLALQLPFILVPREIFFQDEKFQCLNSKISDLRFFEKKELKVQFPLDPLPQTTKEFKRLLLSWILSLYSNEEEEFKIPSHYVTQDLFKKCVPEDQFLSRLKEQLPPLWP